MLIIASFSLAVIIAIMSTWLSVRKATGQILSAYLDTGIRIFAYLQVSSYCVSLTKRVEDIDICSFLLSA